MNNHQQVDIKLKGSRESVSATVQRLRQTFKVNAESKDYTNIESSGVKYYLQVHAPDSAAYEEQVRLLQKLVADWEAVARDAADRGDKAAPGDYPPQYCYGFSNGLLHAIDQTNALIKTLLEAEA